MGGTIANSWPLIQPEKAVKCAENTQNHQQWTEPGPYGSVWADNCAELLPPALGGLWDASRIPKPSKNQKIPGFRGSGGWGVRPPPPPYSPYFPCVGKLELLLQGVVWFFCTQESPDQSKAWTGPLAKPAQKSAAFRQPPGPRALGPPKGPGALGPWRLPAGSRLCISSNRGTWT